MDLRASDCCLTSVDCRGSVDDKGLAPAAGPPLLPNLLFHTGEAVADTTPIIQRLEAAHEHRKVYPSDGGMAFLNKILEVITGTDLQTGTKSIVDQ